LKQSTTISNQPLEPKNLDYHFLYEEAIRYLQKLSGDIWTDFNIHDPGVTILEYLCYGITDLGYRTNLDVKDLLYANDKKSGTDIADALFPPHVIFPAAPLTFIDYRKLLIDKIPEIENCWIEKDFPINGQKGLHKVYLKLDELTILEEGEKVVIENTKELLMANRNLGEDVSDIIILKKQTIAVEANLAVMYNSHAEDVMVKVILALNTFFDMNINYSSRKEILENGGSLENIYDGPLLENGYIDDSELKSRRKVIHIDQIRELLLDVEDVLSVSQIRFRKNNIAIENETIEFEKDEFPTYDKDFLIEPMEVIPIQMDKQNKIVPLDSFKIKRIANTEINKLIQKSTNDKSLKPEKFISDILTEDIAFYSSIQKNFPHVYGITQSRTPLRATVEQKSKAKQLKGYLLLFEHFFSSYLVELTDLRQLFSSEAKFPISQFHHFPSDIPDVDALIRKKNQSNNKIDAINNIKYIDTKLKNVYFKNSSPLRKKNHILNHLIARFSEEISEEHFVQKLNEEDVDLKKIIQAKTAFLQNYPESSRQRGLGLNYTKRAWLNENVSGLKKRICFQLGISNYQNKSLIYPLKNSTRFKREKKQRKIDFTKTKNSSSQSLIPANDLLIYGAQKRYYTLSHIDDKIKVLFNSPNRSHEELPYTIYEGSTVKQCNNAIHNLCKELKEINKLSTGFFIVDHIVLRKRSEPEWSLILYDNEQKILLASLNETNHEKLERLSYKVFLLGCDLANIKIFTVDNSTYGVGLYDEHDVRIMETPSHFILSSAMEKQREVRDFFKKIKNSNPDKINEKIFIQKKSTDESFEDKNIPSNFFNAQLSFIFPKWVPRFFAHKNREHIRSLILENVPAHLKVNFYWLNISEFEVFENLYLKSLNHLALLEDTNEKKQDKINNELAQFLINQL
jgi:hypothetical protein